jgi:hypothetical protein
VIGSEAMATAFERYADFESVQSNGNPYATLLQRVGNSREAAAVFAGRISHLDPSPEFVTGAYVGLVTGLRTREFSEER